MFLGLELVSAMLIDDLFDFIETGTKLIVSNVNQFMVTENVRFR